MLNMLVHWCLWTACLAMHTHDYIWRWFWFPLGLNSEVCNQDEGSEVSTQVCNQYCGLCMWLPPKVAGYMLKWKSKECHPKPLLKWRGVRLPHW